MTRLQIFELILWVDLAIYGFGGWLFAPTLLKLAFPRRPTAASILFRGLNFALGCGLTLVLILLFRLHLNKDNVPGWVDDGLLYTLAAILGILPLACAFFVLRAQHAHGSTLLADSHQSEDAD